MDDEHIGEPGKTIEEFLNQEITCDNGNCIVYGDNIFCRGRERECALYIKWENKMVNKGDK